MMSCSPRKLFKALPASCFLVNASLVTLKKSWSEHSADPPHPIGRQTELVTLQALTGAFSGPSTTPRSQRHPQHPAPAGPQGSNAPALGAGCLRSPSGQPPAAGADAPRALGRGQAGHSAAAPGTGSPRPGRRGPLSGAPPRRPEEARPLRRAARPPPPAPARVAAPPAPHRSPPGPPAAPTARRAADGGGWAPTALSRPPPYLAPPDPEEEAETRGSRLK